MRYCLAITFALPLAACGGNPGADQTPGPSEAASEPLPAAPATPSPAAQTTAIPPAMQGRWGLVPADCTGDPAAAKGLLTIDPATLKFYESAGTLGKVTEAGPDRLRAEFAFTGEGMSWTREEQLEVQGGGTKLIRNEYGEGAMAGPLSYAKCP